MLCFSNNYLKENIKAELSDQDGKREGFEDNDLINMKNEKNSKKEYRANLSEEQKKVIREKDAERKRVKRNEKKQETIVKESSVTIKPLFESSRLFF